MADAASLTDAIALLNLYQTQYTQTDKLWNYFGTVTLAVLAFSLGSERATKTFKEAGVIVGGYVLFCVGNFSALSKAHAQLIEFAGHAQRGARSAGVAMEHLMPLPLPELTGFYWCVVAAVGMGILAISGWRQPARRGRSGRSDA